MDLLKACIFKDDIIDFRAATRVLDAELEKTKSDYADLKLSNKSALKVYKKQSANLTRKWSLCRAELDGFVEECRFINSIALPNNDIIAEDYQQYVQEETFKAAAAAALSDDNELSTFQGYTVRRAIIPLLEILNSNRLVQACRLYCVLYSRKNIERLQALPQQAAIFYIECCLLSDSCDDVKQFAAQFLQQHIQVLLDELDTLRSNVVFLDAQNMEHILRRPFNQLLFQLNRFRSVTECLQIVPDVYTRTMILLDRALSNALFYNLVSIGGIEKSCDLNSVISPVVDFFPSHQYEIKDKLAAINHLGKQPLLSWMGAFRRKSFALDARDYLALIPIFFADSTLRASSLEELQECASDFSEHELLDEPEEPEPTDV